MKKLMIVIFMLLLGIGNIFAQQEPDATLPLRDLINQLPDSFRNTLPEGWEKMSFEDMQKLVPDSIMNAKRKVAPQDELARRGTVPFSAEKLWELSRISDVRLSPDGQNIIYKVSRPNLAANLMKTKYMTTDISGNFSVELPLKGQKPGDWKWMPDSEHFTFTSAGKAYIMHIRNREKPKVYNIGKAGDLSVSNDMTSIAYTSDVKSYDDILDKYPYYKKANVMKFSDLPARNWNHWNDNYHSHLFVAGIDSILGEKQDLSEKLNDEKHYEVYGGSPISYSPDKKWVACAVKALEGYERSTNSDIILYNTTENDWDNITEDNHGADNSPMFSPDGKYVAWISQKRAGFESDRWRLMLYNVEDNDTRELTASLDQWVSEFVWSADSKSIYFTATDYGCMHIFRVSLASGLIDKITDDNYNYSELNVGPDEKTLVFCRESMQDPKEIFKLELPDKKLKRLTQVNSTFFDMIAPIKIEAKYVTATDGDSIHCWVLYPPDFDPNKKYPMITMLQGGPQAMISQRFHYRWNLYLMASKGYIVLASNRRGLPGFGQEWNDAISRDWGGLAMKDIISATDAMLKEDYVNNDAVAAVGASAGGYAAFWLAAHHEGRFCTFISHCGLFNLESFYGATEELWFPAWEFGGPYWEENAKVYYDANSPHRFVKKWDKPILIITGMKDFRVPYTQSLEAFTAAQEMGLESDLIVFPGETHFVLQPQNAMIWQTEFFDWLDKYCK